MPRCRFLPSAALRGALAAGAILFAAQAQAQVTPPFSDPLAPQLSTGQQNPPRFGPVDRRAQAQAGQPTTFAPLPSGAGTTGFDSTNARKKPKPRRNRATAAAQPSIVAPLAAAAPPPEPLAPYQKPIPALGGEAMAAAPGAPPVPPTGPIRKLPPKRKAHADEPTDPYEPLGIRAGAFDLYPAIEFLGGYNTNPGATPGGPGAWLYTVAPELQVRSNWSRHDVKADLHGNYTGFTPDQSPTLSRPYFDGKVESRWDVHDDTHLLFDPHVLVSTDAPNSPNLQAGLAKLPMFVTYGSNLGLRQGFNRFEVTLKGTLERTAYQDSTLTDGTTVSNSDRNFNLYGGTLRGAYEVLPGVKPFVEVGADRRKHDDEFDAFGFARDSKGLTAKAGSTFKLTHVLTGEIALGYTKRTYEDSRLEPLSGLIGDASLIWEATSLTTVKLTGASVVSESTVPGVSGELSRDVGLQVDHALRRWLIASLKAGVGLDDYVGMDREDKRYSVGAGLTYKIDRTTQIKGEFRQDWLRSNVDGNDYTASTFLLGLRFQR